MSVMKRHYGTRLIRAKGLQQKYVALVQSVLKMNHAKIKFQKYKDLQSLKSYIAPIYHSFYDTLLHDESQCNNDDIDIFKDELLDLSKDENNADVSESPAGLPTSSLTMSATVSSISKQTAELKSIGRDLKKNRTYGKPTRIPELDGVHHDRTRNVNCKMRLATIKHSNSNGACGRDASSPTIVHSLKLSNKANVHKLSNANVCVMNE